MLFLDVNICVYAFRPEMSSEAQAVADWLQDRLAVPEVIGINEQVLAATIRITTNARLFHVPAPSVSALEFCDRLRAAPASRTVRPGLRHWTIFASMMSSDLFRANDITDAYLAAQAIEQGATMVTRDRGFRRFDGLRVLDPLAA